MISSIVSYFFWLTIIQLWTQAVSLAIIQMIEGSNWIVEAFRIGLGLTGDNSPKKKHVADDRWISFSYYAFAFLIVYTPVIKSLLGPTSPLYTYGVVFALCCIHCALWRYSGVFILFKFYDGGKGFGFNMYYWGWRKIGLDWHAFQVRQDLVTGKPLLPSEQYFMNRPHIDLPDYNLHHWPWAQNQSHDEMAQLKEAKSEQRKAKLEAKLAKRARREKSLAERATSETSSPDITPTASNAPSPMVSSKSEPEEEEISAAAGLFD